ncbi:MFS general substrate transporter [Thozetella sp. PMI_491]|nr:MFS general substrate transporter [Thozetella sp. PMI_491]
MSEKTATGAATSLSEESNSPSQDIQAPRWKFWAILPPLCISTLLVALESTVTSTALPLITADLKSGDNYVWFLNGYLLTATISLPLYGQFADVFGRRWPTIAAVALFVLGSGISGGATSTAMLIAGRLIQGLGGAGINSFSQIIISDLVPLRERGKYMGLVFAVFGVGTALGPPIGGIIAQSGDWRWVFWLNIPVGGFTLVMQLLFLKRLRQIDWVGNALLSGSVVSVLIALSWADTRYPWGSWQIILPLILGVVGLAGFHIYEASPWCAPRPAIPPRVFGNRTSAVGMVLSFFQSMLIYWRTYFLPLYFQSVLLASPSRSGVLLLPTILMGIPSAIVAGGVLSKTGRYKPIHFFGFAMNVLGTGLFIDYSSSSSLAKVVLYQIVNGFGGVLLTSMVPAIQASHPQADVAVVTSTWSFYRNFGAIWGIAIPAAIFNSQMVRQSSSIHDDTVQELLGSGNAYAHVSSSFIASLPQPLQGEVVNAYGITMRTLWEVCLAFTVLALLLVFVEAEIPLQRTLKSDYQLEGVKKQEDQEAAVPAPPSGTKA